MSFILDALKKSESDRQQKASPGIADVPTSSRPTVTSRWMPVLIALLAVNLAVVMYLFLRPQLPEASAPVTVSTTPAVPSPASADAPAERAATRPEPRTPAAEPVPVAEQSSITSEPDTRPEAAEPRAAPAATTTSSAAAAQSQSAPEDDETFLTLNDLRASGKLDLPEMHIDLHVYSPNPTERFVFVNMNEYRENATMAEGPRVRRITTEGVLLEYRGSTFLLPRD